MSLIEQLSELSDDELLDLADAILQELARRRQASRPRSFIEDVRASIAVDAYRCPTHGTRLASRGEVRQAERDEVCLYVCSLCGRVADQGGETHGG
jgi:hypothetical protein